MFGIADTADSGSSSGESADISGGINCKLPAVFQKRRFSPTGSIEMSPGAKQPKLNDTTTASDSHINSTNIHHSLNNRRLRSCVSRRSKDRNIITQRALEAYDSGSYARGINCIRDTGSDGRQSDYDESSDGRSSARDDSLTFREFEIKEVRVLLHDIMSSEKYRKIVKTSSDKRSSSEKQKKLWEVEKIVQKCEQNGEVRYLVKWKNWNVKYNTWEPMSNLINCEELLFEFENNRQKLIDRFKAKVNFYPKTVHVEHFLTQLLSGNKSIDDVTSAAVIAATEDGVFADIRRYLKNGSRNSKLEAKIKHQILCMLLIEIRRTQLESLQDWENEMNSITKGKPKIQVENLIDLESAPQDFFYIDSYLPGAGVIIPDDPPIGCECNVCESSGKSGCKSNCCFTQNGMQSLPYTTAFRVRVPPGTPIYECNKRCTCDAQTCQNRVVQRGSDMQLCIFRTNNGRGWGVRTLRAIKKGTFVIQYVGEVINSEEAEKRSKQYNITGRTYLFDLDYNETDDQCPYTVDAAMYGNVSHFINHSCDPNLAVYAIWINCLDPNLPNLALFAIKDIKQNEELTFDYTCRESTPNTQTPRNSSEKMQQLDNESDVKSSVSKYRTICKCGAATCRQYLF